MAEDRFWFRPAYTLEVPAVRHGSSRRSASAAARAPERPFLVGLGLLALESLGMLTLVLFMYFRE